ncbi:unnamed protein product [Brassicogethes aeneus]|uniref:Uncharacterized protein n=1 Tax=Brassicogethes aeneus TaxID=1431903 RepID=A0A9P0FLV3_BRAAE|nr:unnamed protein product [Brassicogethes aeneus]
MSDSTKKTITEENIDLFPNLPEALLEEMGLRGNSTSSFSEEEQEQKFTRLSLAFSIDSTSINDRFERQKRQRDQTEHNLMVELEKLTHKINKMKYLCVDFETTELLTALLTQVDIVTKATYLASISAERYGAVQYENRLSESVNLMIAHVNTLKQHRDAARRQLQYTKRVIQETNYEAENNNNNNNDEKVKSAPKNNILVVKNTVIRRASIANISQATDKLMENKKMKRRKSDLYLGTAPAPNRPSRLTELGGDLVKISEGEPISDKNTDEQLLNDDDPTSDDIICFQVKEPAPTNLRQKILYKIKNLQLNMERKYTQWINYSSTDNYYFAALICFTFSLIILLSVWIEIEMTRTLYNT